MLKLSLIVVILLIAAVDIAQSQTSTAFSSVVKIYEDPTPGVVGSSNEYDATLYYDFGSKKMSYVFTAPGSPNLDGYREVFDYAARVQYKACSGCEAFRTGVMPEFHVNQPVDTPGGGAPLQVDTRLCTPFTKADPAAAGGVQTVWINVPNPMFPLVYTTCQVRFTDGKEIVFGPPAGLGLTPFSHPTCAAKCGAPLDLTFVIDESGSINPTEWTLMNTFIKGVIDQFEVGPDATHVGIAYFAGVTYGDSQDPSNCCGLAEATLPLSSNLGNIIGTLDTHVKKGGHTCINCGIRAGGDYYPNPLRTPANRQVMVVITDGYNNRETNYFARDIARVKAQAGGIEMFAVGVSNSDAAQLAMIAGDASRVFRAPDFAGLVSQIGTISNSICDAFPTDTPCGLSCKSKCVCDRKCVCPAKCTDVDACAKGECVSGKGGCKSKPNLCNPPLGQCRDVSACTTSICVAASSPTVPAGSCIDNTAPAGACPPTCITCTIAGAFANDKCSCPACDPLTGICTATRKDCNDDDRCTADECDPLTGQCKNTPVQCVGADGKKNVCEVYTCDKVTGCVTTPVDCSSTPAKTKCHKVECSVDPADPSKPLCVQTPIGGLVDACDNCKSDKLPCALGGSSAIIVSGVVTGLVIATALLGGAFAVGIGACLAARAASGPGFASGAPSAAASVNPLYEDGANSFDNPLAE